MAKLGINTGTAPDAGDGDSLLVGGIKINSNFNELYTFLGDGTNLNSAVWNKTSSGINTLGKVGVGTTNPSSTLDVLGDVKISGVVTASSFVGDVIGTASLASVATTAITSQGLSGTPNITVGIVTSSSTIVGSAVSINSTGINITGITTTSILYVGSGVTIGNTGIISATRFDGTLNAPDFGVITDNLDLYVSTTGSDTTGTGTLSNPWATPHKAADWLSTRSIKYGVSVRVNILDGDYTFTDPLILEHPQGRQIEFLGQSTSGARPKLSLTGSSSGIETGNTSASRTYNVGLLTSFYNTVLRFNGCDGIRCGGNGGTVIDKLLIIGDGSTQFSNGICVGVADSGASGMIGIGTSVAIHNFGQNGIVVRYGGYVFAQEVTVTNCNIGIRVNYAGSVRCGNALASNNTNCGIQIDNTGNIRGLVSYAHYNGSGGFVVSEGGTMDMRAGVSTSNIGAGVSLAYGGTINAVNATIRNNIGAGVSVKYGGVVNLRGATVTNNRTIDIFGFASAVIDVNGATYSTSSPSGINTVGNGMVYITNQ